MTVLKPRIGTDDFEEYKQLVGPEGLKILRNGSFKRSYMVEGVCHNLETGSTNDFIVLSNSMKQCWRWSELKFDLKFHRPQVHLPIKEGNGHYDYCSSYIFSGV